MTIPAPGEHGRTWLDGGLALVLVLAWLLLAPDVALAQTLGAQPALNRVIGSPPALTIASVATVPGAAGSGAHGSVAVLDRAPSRSGGSRVLPRQVMAQAGQPPQANPAPLIPAAPTTSPSLRQSSSEPSLPRVFEQALTASREGRFGDALPLWDQVLELAPEDASAWSNRGNVLLALGDPEAAIAAQDRAMQLDPANADPHLNRGTAEEALGRWAAAAADYHWVLERNPADASALYNLGNVAGSLGDWPAARDCFEQAALARPGFAMARSSAALAAYQQGDLDAAERELRNLIRRYPLFADARAGLTALLWSKGARGEAESNWAAASGLDPRYRQGEWLQQIRRWPPGPIQALDQFLRLAT